MNTLFSKLSIALLVIVGSMGTAFLLLDRINTRAYYEELSQNLNAPIAMYVTQQRQLISNGIPDLESLRELASHAMIINPTAEIYLLDKEGAILGHNLPTTSVLTNNVDLSPVQILVDGNAQFPLRGDDPRNPSVQKIFSAWPVASTYGTEGYLYVILGGQKYEELASNLGNSYVARSSAFAIVAIALFTAIVGLLVFGLLTRRLKCLNGEMLRVTASGFQTLPALTKASGRRDEIDALSNAFIDMSAQISDQIEQLTENDRLRRELVSNISHDLRTPLAAMQGYIDTLIVKSQSMSAEDRDRYLRIAQKHSLRLGSLIGDLFELSKLDAGSVTPSVESFSLPELVQDTAQEFELESERKKIALHVEVGSSPAITMGDIGLIQRVLENLVRNAIQFTPEGGEVTISVSERPNTVSVAVSDSGPGIATEDVTRIFDRFYRARDGEEARSDSSGLGLAIVKRILDLHNTRIEVITKQNSGTRFEFELPLCAKAA
jgi:signal transduction histidine kinase